MDSKRRCFVYLLAVFALSSLMYYLIISRNAFRTLVLLLMWCPAVAALTTSLITGRSFDAIGWRLGNWKWLRLGYLFPLLYSVPAYVLVWILGLGGFPDPRTLDRIRSLLHLSTQSSFLLVLIMLAATAVPGVLFGFIGATGEEIGWRGLLVPELTNWVGFRRAAALSGVIWGLWHVPLILASPYSQSDTPRWYQVTCFFLLIVPAAVAFAWLRMQSKSIWPVVVFHSAHNAFVQEFFDNITLNTGKTHYFTGEFGVAMLPFAALLAFYCWKRTPSDSEPNP